MKNILQFGFVVIFCSFCAINLLCQTDSKSNISVYFIYANNTTVPSSLEAVKTLINDNLNFTGIKKYVVLSKNDPKLSKNLKRDLKLDAVLVNETSGTYKGVALKSPQDILVFGDDNILLQQYSHFSKIVQLLFLNGKPQTVEVHKLSPKIFGESSVVFPIDDEKKGSINLIIPEDVKMICLRNKPKKITEVELPSYFDCYYFFGNTIQSKIYRDDPFKNGAVITKKFYETFDNNLSAIRSLTTGFGDTTGLYITTKNARIKIDSSVMIFREIDQDKLGKLLKKDLYFSQNLSLRGTTRLNDSLMAAMLVKTPGNTNHLALIDMKVNSLRIVHDLDPLMNSDSLVYTRFSGDKNNKMFMLNMKTNELKIINFKSINKPIISNNLDFMQKNLTSKLLDIYASDKILYILYLNPTDPNSLYVEEYVTSDLSFARSYTVDINPSEIELINLAGISDKSLYFFYKNIQGAWALNSFMIY